MTLQSRRILNRLIKCVPSLESPIEVLPNCDYFEIDLSENKRCSFSPYSNEIMSIIPYLESLGYVRIDNNNDTVFYLTHEGFHYKEIAFNKFISFLAKSILVPVVVSACTSLLTMYIGWLLQQP